jgi:LemA protein
VLIVWIIVAIVVVLIAYAVLTYNGLVSMRNRIENAWAQIDVQLKRRYDLIPNLVETVKGYASHERGTLEAVIQARNVAMSAEGPQEQAAAENMITGALKSVFALSEAYPDLKANVNFLNLQEELTGTEGRIAYARQFYNDTVYRYNTKVQSVPSNIIANAFTFAEREYFEVDDAARGNVQVDFGSAPAVDLGGSTPAPTPPADVPPAPPAPPTV